MDIKKARKILMKNPEFKKEYLSLKELQEKIEEILYAEAEDHDLEFHGERVSKLLALFETEIEKAKKEEGLRLVNMIEKRWKELKPNGGLTLDTFLIDWRDSLIKESK